MISVFDILSIDEIGNGEANNLPLQIITNDDFDFLCGVMPPQQYYNRKDYIIIEMMERLSFSSTKYAIHNKKSKTSYCFYAKPNLSIENIKEIFFNKLNILEN